jgi:Uncharacterized protein conserved in bacteria (DUF2199)
MSLLAKACHHCGCVACGQQHSILNAIGIYPRGPSVWEALSPQDQSRRTRHAFALCKIDNQLFFVRCTFTLRAHLPASLLGANSYAPAACVSEKLESAETPLDSHTKVDLAPTESASSASPMHHIHADTSAGSGSGSSRASENSARSQQTESAVTSRGSPGQSRGRLLRAGVSSTTGDGEAISPLLTLWVQVSESSFRRVHRWLQAKCTDEEVDFAGRLATALQLFGESAANGLDLDGAVCLLPGRRLPTFTLSPTNHPLYAAQQDGLSARCTGVLLHTIGVQL